MVCPAVVKLHRPTEDRVQAAPPRAAIRSEVDRGRRFRERFDFDGTGFDNSTRVVAHDVAETIGETSRGLVTNGSTNSWG